MAARSPITGTRSGLQIVEEAVHVLRSAPLRIWSLYLIGALPFALTFTYFVADMSRSAFAAEQLIESSFWLALAFQWKQVWQAVFASELYGLVEGVRRPWTWPRVRQTIVFQCAVQPLSLLVLPLAFLAMFPFPYSVGVFRNLTLYAGLGRENPFRMARRYSGLWTAQAWLALSVFSLLALLLFVNYLATLALVPQLLKSFFGFENAATRYSSWVLNSTVMTATASLVYLSLDPLLDAVYVLRCFYGESVAAGTDLRTGLRRALTLAAMVCLLLCSPHTRLSAQPPATPVAQAPQAIDEGELKRSIDEVVRRREFAWRSPKTVDERDESKFASWVRGVWKAIGRFIDWLSDWVQKVFFPEPALTESGTQGRSSATIVRSLLIALGIGFVLSVAYIFYRQRKAATRRVHAKAVSAKPVIDLRDESVTADQLPEASWYSLAQEWIDKGDLRLALRAMYLGSISHLGQRGLVGIQRWKSGLDYSRELARRTRTAPEVAPAFSRAVRVFECGWYGRHEVSRETLDTFTADFEQVRRGGQ